MPEVLDRGAEGAGASKGLKKQTHRFLHLSIGIEDRASLGIIEQAGRQPAVQLAPARLVEDSAAQARPQHVKLCLAHGSLEPEQ